MIFKFELEQVQAILGALDQMPHGKVRGLMDYIVNEANAQMQAQQAQQMAEQQKAAEKAREELE